MEDSMMTPFVPLPKNEDLDKATLEALDVLPPLHVFRMMANVPGSFQALLNFAGTIFSKHSLDARLREIAVLRVAKMLPCRYVWVQHVIIGRDAGLSDEIINVLEKEVPVTSLPETENLVCRAADEITTRVRLSDQGLSLVLDRFGVQMTSELILVCGYFNMIGRFVESTRVELEARPAAGSLLQAPLFSGQ